MSGALLSLAAASVICVALLMLSASLRALARNGSTHPGMIVGLITCFLPTVAWAVPLWCSVHARATVRR